MRRHDYASSSDLPILPKLDTEVFLPVSLASVDLPACFWVDVVAFAKAIESFRMVHRAFIPALAIILPPLEVLAGALWIVNRASVAAATAILGLCVLFAVALGSAILRGLPTSCGCFGAALDGSSPKVALLRDIFFTAATAYWLVLRRAAPRKARAA